MTRTPYNIIYRSSFLLVFMFACLQIRLWVEFHPIVGEQVTALLEKPPIVINFFESMDGALRPVYATPPLDGESTSATISRRFGGEWISTSQLPQFVLRDKDTRYPIMNWPYSGCLQTYIFRVFKKLSGKGNIPAMKRMMLSIGLLNLIFCLLMVRELSEDPGTTLLTLVFLTGHFLFLGQLAFLSPEVLASLFFYSGSWLYFLFRRTSKSAYLYLGCLLWGLACYQKLPSLWYILPMMILFRPKKITLKNGIIAGSLLLIGCSPVLFSMLLGYDGLSTFGRFSLSEPLSFSLFFQQLFILFPFTFLPLQFFLRLMTSIAPQITMAGIFYIIPLSVGILFAVRNITRRSKKILIYIVCVVGFIVVITGVMNRPMPGFWYYRNLLPFVYIVASQGILSLFPHTLVFRRISMKMVLGMMLIVLLIFSSSLFYHTVRNIYPKHIAKISTLHPTVNQKLSDFLIKKNIGAPLTFHYSFIGTLEFITEGKLAPRHYYPVIDRKIEQERIECLAQILAYEKQGYFINPLHDHFIETGTRFSLSKIESLSERGIHVAPLKGFPILEGGDAFQIIHFQAGK